MKIERNGAYILCIPSRNAYVFDRVFIDLIDRHIKTDIVGRGVSNILHNDVVGISTHGVMTLSIAVKTEQNEICFGKINGKRTVGHDVYDQKAHLFRFDDQIFDCFIAVFPQKSLSSTEKQNSNAHIVETPHLFYNLHVRMDNRRYIIDGAMLAFQIASVRYNDRSKNRISLTEKNRLQSESCEI